jgi:alpha-beta hydrolase superfamily lysophospholipase
MIVVICAGFLYLYNNSTLQPNTTEAVRELTAEHPGHPEHVIGHSLGAVIVIGHSLGAVIVTSAFSDSGFPRF